MLRSRAFTSLAGLLGLALAAASAPALAAEPAHFHHVHLNVVDPAAAIAFYAKNFSAVPVKFAGRADALFTERSFILLSKVAEAPPGELKSGIWHIGWGGIDVPNESAWLVAQGVPVHTPLYRLGQTDIAYFLGPSRELIEVNTMGHRRFGHVHLFAADVNATVDWYARHLGVAPRRASVPKPEPGSGARAWANSFYCDNVQFIVYGRPDSDPLPPWWKEAPLTEFAPTRGRAIDHIAFSYRKLAPEFERMKSGGAEIAEEMRPNDELGLTSFFLNGPDGVLIEIVEAKPIPDASWEK